MASDQVRVLVLKPMKLLLRDDGLSSYKHTALKVVGAELEGADDNESQSHMLLFILTGHSESNRV